MARIPFEEILDLAVGGQLEVLRQLVVTRLKAGGIKPGDEPACLRDRHPVVQGRLVGDVADATADFEPLPAAVEPQHGPLAEIRIDQPQQNPQSRRFAGPVFAQQGHHDARPGRKRNIVEGELSFVALGDPIQ